MQHFNQLAEIEQNYTSFDNERFYLNTPTRSKGNGEKVPGVYYIEKADSPGKFLERNLIFLLAFIFMICLANLITILFLINIFL
jgi:hypothetical protein